jgi:hypothetical protein
LKPRVSAVVMMSVRRVSDGMAQPSLVASALGLVQVVNEALELVDREQRHLPRPYVQDFGEERLVAGYVIGVPSGAAPAAGVGSAFAASPAAASSRISSATPAKMEPIISP